MIIATNCDCIGCIISQRVVQILLTSTWDFTRRKKNLQSGPWYMLDTARVNSSTIFALNQGKDPIEERSFEYTYQLVMELVKPTIEIRN